MNEFLFQTTHEKPMGIISGNTMTVARNKEATFQVNAGLQHGGDGDEGWRALLLRALIRGDLDRVALVLQDQVDAVSLPFTKQMPSWKVQWESSYWWMLKDATPLFIASAYSEPTIVEWLLAHGADRESRCYLNLTPVDVVGECCETSSILHIRNGTDAVKRSELCRQYLSTPPSLPAPPTEHVNFASHALSQTVVVKAALASKPSPSSKGSAVTDVSVTQTVYWCLVDVVWDTPLSNGALIDRYEIKYRQIADDDSSSTDGGSWRVERTNHNRKSKQQGVLCEGLQFNTTYEFMLRSRNVAGKGEWGRLYKYHTMASPEQPDSKGY